MTATRVLGWVLRHSAFGPTALARPAAPALLLAARPHLFLSAPPEAASRPLHPSTCQPSCCTTAAMPPCARKHTRSRPRPAQAADRASCRWSSKGGAGAGHAGQAAMPHRLHAWHTVPAHLILSPSASRAMPHQARACCCCLCVHHTAAAPRIKAAAAATAGDGGPSAWPAQAAAACAARRDLLARLGGLGRARAGAAPGQVARTAAQISLLPTTSRRPAEAPKIEAVLKPAGLRRLLPPARHISRRCCAPVIIA